MGGQGLPADLALLDLQTHPVFNLDEQLAMFDASKGQSEAQYAQSEMARFFAEIGSINKDELKRVEDGSYATDKFLKLIKAHTLLQVNGCPSALKGRLRPSLLFNAVKIILYKIWRVFINGFYSELGMISHIGADAFAVWIPDLADTRALWKEIRWLLDVGFYVRTMSGCSAEGRVGPRRRYSMY